MDFLITIDTEADNQWARPEKVTTGNIRHIPRFQSLCDRYGLRPTYLCTHEVAADPACREVLGPLQESGRAEIGAHLHPWTTPPYGDQEGPPGRHQAFPHELSDDLFGRKLACLTETVAGGFGRTPRSYRAGRFGFAPRHAGILSGLGYRVDCSVAPYMSYAHMRGLPDGAGGPDFRDAGPAPWMIRTAGGTDAAPGGLLEVPVTILFPRRPFLRSRRLQRWWVQRPRSLIRRGLNRLGFGPRWMRPWPSSDGRDLIAVYSAAARLGLPCVEMMFHSSELMPGGSPLFPDAASVERLYRALETVFAHAVSAGARGATLTAFAEEWMAGRADGGQAG